MIIDDQQLIQQAQAGKTAAFAELVNRHGQMVYNLALRTLNDPHEAEDIAQETFVRAWQSLKRFRGDARFSTWLYRITTNLCFNRLPRMKSELKALDTETADELTDQRLRVEGQLLSVELHNQLHAAIDNLPESYRLLITLRHLQELSYAEIAEITNMPLGTVKTGIFRARRLLRDALKQVESAYNG